jgi:hypothetical protein
LERRGIKKAKMNLAISPDGGYNLHVTAVKTPVVNSSKQSMVDERVNPEIEIARKAL